MASCTGTGGLDPVPAARAGHGVARASSSSCRSYYLANTSLQTGSLDVGYTFTGPGQLLGRDLDATTSSSCARSSTPGSRRSIALARQLPARLLDRLPRRPLEEPAPAAGHRAVLRHVPDPDARLADDPLRQRLRREHARRRRHARRRTAGCSRPRPPSSPGITYNFLPFMVLPLYVSLEQIDARLIEAAQDLYASQVEGVPARDAAALAAGRLRRHAAHVHPGGGRLHQRRSCSARRAST